MPDIQIAGAVYPDVPAIDVPLSSGGGTTRFWDMSGEMDWLGCDETFVKRLCNVSLNLSDTNYGNYVPSDFSAQKTVMPSTSLSTESVDMENYEYYVRWRIKVDVAYNASHTAKQCVDCTYASYWSALNRRPNSLATMRSLTDAANYCTPAFQNNYTPSISLYHNANGALATVANLQYGIYPLLVAGTFASTTALNTTFTPKTPTLNCRINNSYMIADRYAEVDAAKTTIKYAGDLYRIKRGYVAIRHAYRDAYYLLEHDI